MYKRYKMWAGMGVPEWLIAVLDGKKPKSAEPAIWPIIDDETCGEIQGEPMPDQFFCIAFTSDTQRTICNALNASQSGVAPNRLQPGEPCDHPGCLQHRTHPCEGCGRTAGR